MSHAPATRWRDASQGFRHAAVADAMDGFARDGTRERQWPEPVPINGAIPPVEALTEALLPDGFRCWLTDCAERLQVPLEFVAAPAIVALSAVVGRRVRILPRRRDEWSVTSNLWGAIIGRPGILKSPSIREGMKPLYGLRKKAKENFDSANKEYSRLEYHHKLDRQVWETQYKQAKKTGKPEPEEPSLDQEQPTQRRYFTNDATPEALHKILTENPGGVLVFRDELAGWMASLERFGRENARTLFLEGWNGDSPFDYDTIGRGNLSAEANCVSILGGIQPERLRSYMADAVGLGKDDDGLIQRFQVLVWPDAPRDWLDIDRPPHKEAAEVAFAVFERLAELDPQNPLELRFSEDAQQLFSEWYEANELRVRAGELHPALESHLAKYRSLVPSLAGLLHLVDWVFSEAGNTRISLSAAQRAAAWAAFLESHAVRVYSCVTTPQKRAAALLAEKISAGKLPDPFTARDVYRRNWTGLDEANTVFTALEILEECGWVESSRVEPGALGGRATTQYQINPRARGNRHE